MSSTNAPRDSLSDYEFSFEAYLDYTTGIEVDVSLIGLPSMGPHSTDAHIQ